MAAAADNRTDITEHMTRLRIRLLRQKVDREKEQRHEEPDGEELNSGPTDEEGDPRRVRYYRNLLKRQELLEKLKVYRTTPSGKPLDYHDKEPRKLHRNPRRFHTSSVGLEYDSEREHSPYQLTPTVHRDGQYAERKGYSPAYSPHKTPRPKNRTHQPSRSISRQSLPELRRSKPPDRPPYSFEEMGSPATTASNKKSTIDNSKQKNDKNTDSKVSKSQDSTAESRPPGLSRQSAQSQPQRFISSNPEFLAGNPGLLHQAHNPGLPFPSLNMINGGTTTGQPGSVPASEKKSDYMDMMMMQSWQTQQYFLQQLLINSMAGNKAANPSPVIINERSPQPPYIYSINSETSRPATVHHHHYKQVPPIGQPEPAVIRHVKLVEPPTPPLSPPRAPRAVPVRKTSPREITPLQLPRARPRTRPAPPPEPSPEVRKHPFPGSDALRKLRHIFYAAWFISFVKIAAKKRREGKAPSDDKFLFGILLKEAVAAVHRIYLNPDGQIYPLLRDCVSLGAVDLSKAFTGNQKTLQELVYIVENLVFHITEIMPKTGVLGTHKKAATFEVLKTGKPFPDGYFWQVEKDEMSFAADGRTLDVDKDQACMLLIGMFFSRSLMTTLLMKPLDYGLSTTLLDETAERNLRLLASIIMYIIRVSTPVKSAKVMDLPYEVSRYLLSDEELKPIVTKIKKTIDYSIELIRGWSREYVTRLRAAGDTKG